MADPFVEIRGELPVEIVEVLDAVAQATPGASRMSLMREILGKWASQKVHESTLVMRVRGGNGNRTESRRSRAGTVNPTGELGL